MSNVRKAHSVEIIDKRLRDCETSGKPDAMELIGIYDELSRVERKWLLKAGNRAAGASPISAGRQRPLANEKKINARFDRLRNLIDAVARNTSGLPPQEHEYLLSIAQQLKTRSPLQPPDDLPTLPSTRESGLG